MSDTEFMAIKAFEGKAVTVTGAIDAVNDTIEYVPANGKTFYFHSAKIIMTGHPDLATFTGTQSNSVMDNRIEADLKIDSAVVDTANAGIGGTKSSNNDGSGIGGFGALQESHFDVKGRTLEGDGAKKIEIENVLDSGSANATLIGWIEDTGDSPQI